AWRWGGACGGPAAAGGRRRSPRTARVRAGRRADPRTSASRRREMAEMRTFRWMAMAAVTAVAATALGGQALAGGGPRTSQVSGTFSGYGVSDDPTFCAGIDGQYVDDRGVSTGTVTSDDPRLSGDFVDHVRT